MTSFDGHEQYRPLDKTRKEARFGAKKRDAAAEDSIQFTMRSLKDQFSKVRKKLSEQEKTIKSLKLSNAVQKQKLAELRDNRGDGGGAGAATKKKGMPKQGTFRGKTLRDHDEWALTGDRGFMPTEPSNLKGFISTQFREEIEDTEDILVIDDPDSITGGTKKKKKKKATKRLEESDKDSNASDVLARSQKPLKWHRLSSDRSSMPGYKLLSPKGQHSEEESGDEDEMKKLVKERDAVEDRLAIMQRKMEGLEWAEKAHEYREAIEQTVVLFRMAIINSYSHKEESQDLLDARSDMKHVTTTLQQNGFTLTVCEDFVDRVKKTIRLGFIPEQRFTMKVMDNSADDPVQGYVCDVTYCLMIPMVVKREKVDKEDDLEIVRVTPATKNITDVLKVVKTEKTTPPSSPQKGLTREGGTSPQKNTAEDNSTPPNKDATGSSPKKNTTDTEDKSTAHDKDVTEDNAVSPQR